MLSLYAVGLFTKVLGSEMEVFSEDLFVIFVSFFYCILQLNATSMRVWEKRHKRGLDSLGNTYRLDKVN